MKKLTLTIAVVLSAALSGFSQGQVNFENANANGYVIQSSADHTAASANSYVQSSAFTAQLWALSGPTTTVPGAVDSYGYLAPSALLSSGFAFTGTSIAGSAGAFGPVTAVVPGTSANTTVLAVVCWTGASTTFAQALSAYNAGTAFMGILAFAQQIAGAPPAGLTGQTDIAIGWNALANSPLSGAKDGSQDLIMTVGAVPEPSTLALAGLGGFGMLMAMRRKKA